MFRTIPPFAMLGRGMALATLVVLALAGPAAAAPPSGVVNINTATTVELTRLPGVGESRAKAIVALRRTRGGFKRVEELRDVKGIGDAALQKLRPHVALKGATTLRE